MDLYLRISFLLLWLLIGIVVTSIPASTVHAQSPREACLNAVARYERNGPGDVQAVYEILKTVLPAHADLYGADSMETGQCVLYLGRASFRLNKLDEAYAADLRALTIAERHQGKSGPAVGTALSQLGDVLGQLGRSDEAVSAYKRALSIAVAQLGKKHPLVGYYHRDIGRVFENDSRYDEALREFDAAIAVMGNALKATNRDLLDVRLDRATTLATLRRNDEALTEYQTVLSLIAASLGKDSVEYALVENSMAQIYQSSARYGDALKILQDVLEIFSTKLPPNDLRLADLYSNTATVLMGLGRYGDALDLYHRAAMVLDRNERTDAIDRASLEIATGSALSDLNRYDDALAQYQAALPALLNRFGERHLRVAVLRSTMGVTYLALGRYTEALQSHDLAIATLNDIGGPAYFELAKELANRANALEGLGRRDEAVESVLRALVIQRASNAEDIGGLRQLYYVLSRNLRAKNDVRAAALFAKLAVNAHQEVRANSKALPSVLRVSLAGRMRDAYLLLMERQIADGAFAEAQFAGSLMKSDEFSEFTGVNGSSIAEARLTKSEQALMRQFDEKLRPAVDAAIQLQKEYIRQKRDEKQEVRLSSRFKRLSSAFDRSLAAFVQSTYDIIERAEQDRQSIQAEQLTLNERYAKDLRTQLAAFGDTAALYQAFATDTALHLFVSTASGQTIHREVEIGRAELAKQVYDAVAAIEMRDPDADRRLAGLYDLLIKPIEPDLERVHPQVVMLNLGGFLRYVPYAALRSPQGYLIERYALSLYTPAAHTTFEISSHTDTIGVGFGTAAEHESFAALPGVTRELEAIFSGSDNIGPVRGMPMIDTAFSLVGLKSALARTPRYVHFASHFRFVPGNENNSFLLLGTGEHLDLATFRTNPGLTFKGVDLVTLSACETARGGGSEGEEIESFGTLVQLKGASAVMATLWQIADESTAVLMRDFYRGMVVDGLDKATALQQAQIAMIKGGRSVEVAIKSNRGMEPIDEDEAPIQVSSDTSHPYYWSAFILMGNWR